MSGSLRREIVDALADGFGGEVRIEHVRTGGQVSESRVFVGDVDEPIVVRGHHARLRSADRQTLLIPDALASATPGIRLDVETILSERRAARAARG